jgi:hypothetical protein
MYQTLVAQSVLGWIFAYGGRESVVGQGWQLRTPGQELSLPSGNRYESDTLALKLGSSVACEVQHSPQANHTKT